MRKRLLSIALALCMACSLLGGTAFANGDEVDPYWDQATYDMVAAKVTANVPQVLDADGAFVYKTVDGTFTYSVSITDEKFASYVRQTEEFYYEAYVNPLSGSTVNASYAQRKSQMVTDYTEVFKAAMADVKAAGGGTVYVPEGVYYTGAIKLLADNTRLHLDDNAEIRFIRNIGYEFYPMEKTRWEGCDLMGYSALIYAYQLENIAVTGKGLLNGQGNSLNWLPYKSGPRYVVPAELIAEINAAVEAETITAAEINTKVNAGKVIIPMQQGSASSSYTAPAGYVPRADAYKSTTWEDGTLLTARDRLFKFAEEWVPIEERIFDDYNDDEFYMENFGLDSTNWDPYLKSANTLRPSFVQPYECKNILISDFTLISSPMWEIHPILSENVLVKGTTISSHLGNNDGCNPESTQYVIIEENNFDTGDDCIAIKSGRNNDGYTAWNKPSMYIIVRNNIMQDGHGAVTAGSEMSGGIQYVFAHENVFDSPNLNQGLRIKTNSVRGGYLKNVYMKDSIINQIGQAPIHCTFYYEENDRGARAPVVKDIYVSNYNTAEGVTSLNASWFVYCRTYGYCPAENIFIKDCNFNGMKNAPNNATPAALNDIICSTSVKFENVTINGEPYVSPEKSVLSIANPGYLRGSFLFPQISGGVYNATLPFGALVQVAGWMEVEEFISKYAVFYSTSNNLNTLSLNSNNVKYVMEGGYPGVDEWSLFLVSIGDVNLATGYQPGKFEMTVRNKMYTEDQAFYYEKFKVTDVKSANISERVTQLVANRAAVLNYYVDGENLEYVEAYIKLGDKYISAKIVDGVATFNLSADFMNVEPGTYEIGVYDYGYDYILYSGSLTVAAEPASIWTASALISEGKTVVSFAAPVALAAGSKVTVNGTEAAAAADENLVIVESAESGTVVLSGVMFPSLYPSYKFTFTVNAE